MSGTTRSIITFNLVISALIMFDSFDVATLMVRFLVAGELPWSSIIISPNGMLTIFAAISAVIAAIFISRLQVRRTHALAASPAAKRRYSSV